MVQQLPRGAVFTATSRDRGAASTRAYRPIPVLHRLLIHNPPTPTPRKPDGTRSDCQHLLTPNTEIDGSLAGILNRDGHRLRRGLHGREVVKDVAKSRNGVQQMGACEKRLSRRGRQRAQPRATELASGFPLPRTLTSASGSKDSILLADAVQSARWCTRATALLADAVTNCLTSEK